MQDDHFWPLQWSPPIAPANSETSSRISERIVKKPLALFPEREEATKQEANKKQEFTRTYGYRTHPAILANIPLATQSAASLSLPDVASGAGIFLQNLATKTGGDIGRKPPIEPAEMKKWLASDRSRLPLFETQSVCGPAGSGLGDCSERLARWAAATNPRKLENGFLDNSTLNNNNNPTTKLNTTTRLKLTERLDSLSERYLGEDDKINLSFFLNEFETRKCDLGELLASLLQNLLIKLPNSMIKYKLLRLIGQLYVEPALAEVAQPEGPSKWPCREADLRLFEATMDAFLEEAAGCEFPVRNLSPSNQFQRPPPPASQSDERHLNLNQLPNYSYDLLIGGGDDDEESRLQLPAGRSSFEPSCNIDELQRGFTINNDELFELPEELLIGGGRAASEQVSTLNKQNNSLFGENFAQLTSGRQVGAPEVPELGSLDELMRGRTLLGSSSRGRAGEAENEVAGLIDDRLTFGELSCCGLGAGGQPELAGWPNYPSSRPFQLAARCVEPPILSQSPSPASARRQDSWRLAGSSPQVDLSFAAAGRSGQFCFTSGQPLPTTSKPMAWTDSNCFQTHHNAIRVPPPSPTFQRPYLSQVELRQNPIQQQQQQSALWSSQKFAGHFRCCSSMSVPCANSPLVCRHQNHQQACYQPANYQEDGVNFDWNINQKPLGGGGGGVQQQSTHYYKLAPGSSQTLFNPPASLPSSPGDRLALTRRPAPEVAWSTSGGRRRHNHSSRIPLPAGEEEEEDEEGEDEDEEDSIVSVVVAPARANLPLSIAEQMKEQASNFVHQYQAVGGKGQNKKRTTSSNSNKTHHHQERHQTSQTRQRPHLQVRRTLRVKIKKSKPILGIAIEGGFNVSGQLLPRIVCVHEDGAAYQCGKLRASDLILEVNGIPTVNMTHDEIAKTIANAYYQDQRPFIEFLIGESVHL